MNHGGAGVLMLGREPANRILADARANAERMAALRGVSPTLATVIVGRDSPSAVYVRAKQRTCQAAGIRSLTVELDENTTTEHFLAEVRRLAADPFVHAILIQHPVPAPIDRRAGFEAVPIKKDVDCVSSTALGRVILGMDAFPPCTPAGIMRLLIEHQVRLDGAHAVVVGRSPILGRPMASMLINVHATVTLCHSRTRDLPAIVRQADLLIAAVGRARFVQGDWIKPGAVVIDAGYNEGIVGDVDFDAAREKASWITPVPGGVGPMTVATLMNHTVQAAARQLSVPL